jgi:lysozyme family protein
MALAEESRTVGDFARALPILLRNEGGFVYDPDDSGGATNYGVTEKVFHAWLRHHGQPLRPVQEITQGEVAEIYRGSYWTPAHCDRMPWPLNLIHFDCAANTGIGAAAKQLQRALDVAVDGIIGPLTLSRCAPAGPRECYRYLLERAFYYRAIVRRNSSQLKFLAGGWLARLELLYAEIR